MMRAFLSILFFAAAAQVALAFPRSLETFETVPPHPGWIAFCTQHRDPCVFDPREPEGLKLEGEVWRQLYETREEIAQKTGASDAQAFHDAMRLALVARGIPARHLRMAVVRERDRDRRSEHVVLLLRAKTGDFVIDPRRRQILPWHDTGYVFVAREGSQTTRWLSLGSVFVPRRQ